MAETTWGERPEIEDQPPDRHPADTSGSREKARRLVVEGIEVEVDEFERAGIQGLCTTHDTMDITVTPEEADKILEAFRQTFPSIELFRLSPAMKIPDEGYTVTPMGRKRYFK